MSIVTLDDLALQREAAELYRSVFGYADPVYAVSPRLLSSLLINGGSAIGVQAADGRLIAFCYGYPGVEGGSMFHFSQATVVSRGMQGRGVGRLLKLAQAEVALAAGAGTMRWMFDPLSVRNAHFNLESLGALGCAYYPDFYHEPGSDRMLVEWALAGGRGRDTPEASRRAELGEVFAAIAERPTAPGVLAGGVQDGGEQGYRWLRLPSDPPGDAVARHALRAAVGTVCRDAFDAGLAALACRREPGRAGTAVYLFGERPR